MTDDAPNKSSNGRLRTLRKTVEYFAHRFRREGGASSETIAELTEVAELLQGLESAHETPQSSNQETELQRVYKLVDHWYGETKRLRAALERIGNPLLVYASDEDDDHDTQLSMRMADARAALSAPTRAVETTVTPEFAAGFERGIVKTVLKEVEALTQGRTDAFWSGVSTAIDETTHRLEEAWNNLPVKASCEHRNQRQGVRGPAYCADCGEQVDGDLRPTQNG